MSTWVFGYGSLVWRPAFPHAARIPAWLSGWERRFWQGSPDHRGVPGAPGRVCTLVPGERVWGMAYRLAPGTEAATLAALDVREIAGYDRIEAPLALPGGAVNGTAWVATADNPDWLGPADLDAMAAQIRSARGPSGSNVEYVLRLADALDAHGVHDDHTAVLAARVKALGHAPR